MKEQPAADRCQPTAEVNVPRDKVIMECTECRERNYFTDKNRRKHPERVEWKKFCPRCNQHKTHKESK